MSGLHAQALLNAAAECLFVVQSTELLQNFILMGLILITARVHLRDQGIKIWVGAKRTLGHKLLPAGRTFFISAVENN